MYIFRVFRLTHSSRSHDRLVFSVLTSLAGRRIVSSLVNMSLVHRTIFEDSKKVAVQLPFAEELENLHPGGTFPLLLDPLENKKASIVGMFVLRPADNEAFTAPLLEGEVPNQAVFDPKHDWVYNIDGFSGGWLIANFNGVDAYRLGMQYGVSDAVIYSSNIVCCDGIDTDTTPGYVWQPYNPLNWPSVATLEPNALAMVAKTRRIWQDKGYLSDRKYPAQIVFTWTGLKYDNSRDFLEGAIFTKKHPDGSDMEVYIMTSELGASRIRSRCALYGLQDRIENMLIVLPPTQRKLGEGELSEDIDLTVIPQLLYEKYNMKIVNHDGGHKVLAEFCRAGVISQMNLTLCRKFTIREVLAAMPHIPQEKKDEAFADFDRRLYHFFSYPLPEAANGSSDPKKHNSISRGVPPNMPIASIIADDLNEVSVYVFDTREGFDFYCT